MDIRIDKFMIRDYDAAYELWERCDGISLNESDTRENVVLFLEHNPGLSWVAYAGDRLIGAVLCGFDGRRGYLHHLAVEPEFRGAGIGTRLVNRGIKSLSEVGALKCNVYIERDNVEGRKFWDKARWVSREEWLVMQKPL